MTLVRLAAMVIWLFILVGYTLQYISLCIKTKQAKMRANGCVNYITSKCFMCVLFVEKKNK